LGFAWEAGLDDLLTEFLTETAESLETIDTELVKFESHPNDRAILDNIFRLVHTIKGTCGFLGLPRLEAVAHAGETLLGRFRDGKLEVTPPLVSLVLEAIDQIKCVLAHLESDGVEPEGNDEALIGRLEAAAEGETIAPPVIMAVPEPEPETHPEIIEASGERWDHDLGRALRPGEVSLADLEAAFQNAGFDASDDAAPSSTASPVKPAVEAAPANPAPTPARPLVTAASEAHEDREVGASSLANQSIRVGVDVLENLMTMVSELVLTRNQLMQMVRNSNDTEFKTPLQRLSNITAELQEGVMKTRMQPIGNAWKKLPRIVRDCAHETGKKIKLVLEGEETELDRQVLELIKDPLTHMIRNSCDHGIEKPEDRAMQGKADTGTLKLRAFHEGGYIIIEISDDGAGLNTERIKRKAVEKGLISEGDADTLSEAQIHRFIFAPGFSTAAKVTNLSGRGVGMDVVRTNIEQIGGTVDLSSVGGRGSVFTIKIPLTLAIVSALIVDAGASRFAIPQLSVLELVRVGARGGTQVESVNGAEVIRLRERLLPLVRLARVLDLDERATQRADGSFFVVVMQVGGQRFGLMVDEVFDTEEIVVKPLAKALSNVTTYTGNTILGDGSVIMIIDPNGICSHIGESTEELERTEEAQNSFNAQEERESMLVFRAGSGDPKAVPLSLMTRLEEIEVTAVEHANGKNVFQYRGELVPLVMASDFMSLKAQGSQPVLVFADQGRTVGLMVDEIVDIVEEAVEIEMESHLGGVIGTAVLRGKATDILDVGYFLTQAYPDWFERRTPSQAAVTATRRVLLVDDSAFFRNMMRPLLNAAGYDVIAVASPDEAWALNASGAAFDAIITDIEMPQVDGFDFARKLMTDPLWSDIPRIALSATPASELAHRNDGAFADFIPKTDRASLVATLEYTLKNELESAA
jgi:two-component system, chemotaxis family, sensor kinase CheA